MSPNHKVQAHISKTEQFYSQANFTR